MTGFILLNKQWYWETRRASADILMSQKITMYGRKRGPFHFCVVVRSKVSCNCSSNKREAGQDKSWGNNIITGLFDSLDRRTWSWVQRIELLHYHCGLDDIRYSDTSGMATDTVLDKECPEQNRVIIILASTLPPSNHQNFLRHHTVRKSCWERQSPVDRSIGYNHRRLFFFILVTTITWIHSIITT